MQIGRAEPRCKPMALVFGAILTARTIGPEWGVSRRQLLQQRLRFLQIARVEPFSEPPVNGANSSRASRTLPWSRQRRAMLIAARSFQDFTLLLAGDGEGALKISLLCFVRSRTSARFSGDTIYLGFKPSFLGCLNRGHRFSNAAPGIIDLSKFCVGSCQM